MAIDTPPNSRNLVIYEIYVRNHGPNGNFADVAADLARIRDLGVDYIWFMPIHPIGAVQRKGRLGSPYSIRDYREVNPEYGSKEEFRQLCQYAHALGLKVMIDVVYNHTAHDADLVSSHPHWYHQDENGRPFTTVPEWWDVIDLVYDDKSLWQYQIETLKQWVQLGVDGFRCDVASIVPLDFWQEARAAVAEVKPTVLWLAESVHSRFIFDRRREGLNGHSDGEIHRAFDLSYDYDLWPVWERAVKDPTAVPLYLSLLTYQQAIYPAHTVKMRCVENHDQPRIMKAAPTRAQALAWTAFQAFNEGAFLIYAGQESENAHTPTLFDIEKIKWGSYSLQPFLTRLCRLKKEPIQQTGQFTLLAAAPAIAAQWQAADSGLFGAFNVNGVVDIMATPLPDGEYQDLLSDTLVTVRDGEMAVPETAVILRYSGTLASKPFYGPLL
jgi:glycosidase